MTKQEAFDEINQIQDYYIDELIKLINSPDYAMMKSIDFTSATGTGKTKMMSKLINRFPDYYFIVTTLSKGQLHLQIRDSLQKDCNQDNFYVYGSADYKINSKLEAEDIIGRIPSGAKCIWLRDEGHIKTNRFDELLLNVCYKVINFSATNMHSDIQCNFTQTMMLRTVNQTNGTPEDAIKKLLEIKEAHRGVTGYNPCAIFRCVGDDIVLHDTIVNLCDSNGLKYIDITEESFCMSELCEDDNEYDVIINKFKIVEGIDIRRAHVLYMDNQPANNATTIQVIGRCRRNALLYRNDIDILASENEDLLSITRECFVFYNVKEMKIATDIDGELQYAFCDHISCEQIKPNSVVSVVNGQLQNGLYVIELEGLTGKFNIIKDEKTGFNVIQQPIDYYSECIENNNDDEYIYIDSIDYTKKPSNISKRIKIETVKGLPVFNTVSRYDFGICKRVEDVVEPYYKLSNLILGFDIDNLVSKSILDLFDEYMCKYTASYLSSHIQELDKSIILDSKISSIFDDCGINYLKKCAKDSFYKRIRKIDNMPIAIDGFSYKLKDLCELMKYHYYRRVVAISMRLKI